MHRNPQTFRRCAFSLVELLVVIGILFLLIALFLPSLAKARTAANTVSCLANLRSIGQAMLLYATQHNGYIPGSGLTTGRHVWFHNTTTHTANLIPGMTINNIPGVNEPLDWIGPLARTMGLNDPSLESNNGKARFRYYCEAKEFSCPGYVGVAWTPSSAGSITEGVRQALSYNTALAFLNVAWARYPYGNEDGFANQVSLPGTPYWTAPDGYVPKLGKIGSSAEKIFAADGARRTRPFGATGFKTEYCLTASPQTLGTNETMFADYGPFCGNTRSYSRGAVPGNVSTPPEFDLRILAFRHGTTRPGLKPGAYRMNAVFYDGHAESLDDLTAANPALWLPRGSVITTPNAPSGTEDGSNIIYADVAAHYLPGVSPANPWIAP